MKKLFEKPAVCIEAANQKPGMFWALELLVFIAVFFVSSFAQVLLMLPGELILMYTNADYQAGIATQDMQKIMDAAMAITNSDIYTIVSLFSGIMLILVVCLFCKLIQKRKMRTLGFRKQGILKNYLIGMLVGFGLFSAVVLLSVVSGGMSLNGISPDFSFGMFLLFLAGFMVQGMSEEVLCRGYFMVSVGRRYPMVVAILFNSLFFALLHLFNDGLTALSIVNLALLGIFTSVYFIRSGNIWGVGALHSVWNLAQGNVYGIRVSGLNLKTTVFSSSIVEGKELLNGGAFGLEGSIWTTLVLVAGIVVLYFWGKKKEENAVE